MLGLPVDELSMKSAFALGLMARLASRVVAHLLGQVAVRPRQAERQTGADLVDCAARYAGRVCRRANL